MERCAYCKGEDAELYESGLLICLKCVALQEAKAKKDHPTSVHAALVRALADATLQAESATVEFNAVTNNVPDFIPHPDGVQGIHNVAHKLSIARDEMMSAHHRLNDF